jgi:hypothetical protein
VIQETRAPPAQGLKGDTGDAGATGAQGLKGDTGDGRHRCTSLKGYRDRAQGISEMIYQHRLCVRREHSSTVKQPV